MAAVVGASIFEGASKVSAVATHAGKWMAIATDATGVAIFLREEDQEAPVRSPADPFVPGPRRCVRELLGVPSGTFNALGDAQPAFLALDEAGILTCLSRAGEQLCSCALLPPGKGSTGLSAGGIASLAVLKASPPGVVCTTPSIVVAGSTQSGRVAAARLTLLPAPATSSSAAAAGVAPRCIMFRLPPAAVLPLASSTPEALSEVPAVGHPVATVCSTSAADDPWNISCTFAADASLVLPGTPVRLVADPLAGKAALVITSHSTAATGLVRELEAGTSHTAGIVPFAPLPGCDVGALPAPFIAASSAGAAQSSAIPSRSGHSVGVATGSVTAAAAMLLPARLRAATAAAAAAAAAAATTTVAGSPSKASAASAAGAAAPAPAAAGWRCVTALATRTGELSICEGDVTLAQTPLTTVKDALSVRVEHLSKQGSAMAAVVTATCLAAMPSADGESCVLAVGCSDRTLRLFGAGWAQLEAARSAPTADRAGCLKPLSRVSLAGIPTAVSANAEHGVFVVGCGVIGIPTGGVVLVVKPPASASEAEAEADGSAAYAKRPGQASQLPQAAAAAGASSAGSVSVGVAAAAAAAGGVLSGGSSAVGRAARLVAGAFVQSKAVAMAQAKATREALAAYDKAVTSYPAEAEALSRERATLSEQLETLTKEAGLGSMDPRELAAMKVLEEGMGLQSVPCVPADCVPVHALWSERGSFGPAPALARQIARELAASAGSAGGTDEFDAAAKSASELEADDDAAARDAAEVGSPAWTDRVALFRDTHPATGRTVVVVARWLPHRGGWIEVARYAAAEGSTLGLSAAEDEVAAYVAVHYSYRLAPSQTFQVHALHHLDMASSNEACFDQILCEFGLKDSESTRAAVMGQVTMAKMDCGAASGRIASRPMRVLEQAGATLAGNDKEAIDAHEDERHAARTIARRRQNTRLAVGLEDRMVGEHSRRSIYRQELWQPTNPSFPAARLAVPDGTLQEGDFSGEVGDSGPIAGSEWELGWAARPSPAGAWALLGKWSACIRTKINLDPMQRGAVEAKAGAGHPSAARLQQLATTLHVNWMLPQLTFTVSEVDAIMKGLHHGGLALSMVLALASASMRFAGFREKLVCEVPEGGRLGHALVDGAAAVLRDEGATFACKARSAMLLQEAGSYPDAIEILLPRLASVSAAVAASEAGLTEKQADNLRKIVRDVLLNSAICCLGAAVDAKAGAAEGAAALLPLVLKMAQEAVAEAKAALSAGAAGTTDLATEVPQLGRVLHSLAAIMLAASACGAPLADHAAAVDVFRTCLSDLNSKELTWIAATVLRCVA